MHHKKIYYSIVFIAFTIILSACDTHKKDKEILTHAESLLLTRPDSALQLLDSIYYPKNISPEFYDHYTLVRLQAKYRRNEDLSTDTMIFHIRDHYLTKMDKENSALATFLSACVLEDQSMTNSAMSTYIEAEKYAEETDNLYLQGQIQANIGDLYYTQLLMDEAINRYSRTVDIYNRANDYRRTITAYNRLGNAYHSKSIENDSAFIFYNKALELARKHNDNYEQGYLLRNIGIAYLGKKDPNIALQYFDAAMPFCIKDTDKVMNYLNIATAYCDKQQIDSAIFYTNKAAAFDPEKKNNSIQRKLTNVQYQIEEANNNHKKALEYHKEYVLHIEKKVDERNKQAILEVQKRYNFEQMKNENNRLEIERQNIAIAFLGLFIFIVLLTALFVWRHIKDKQALLIAEQKGYQMKLLADSYDEKNNSMRNIVLEHFNILKKTALIEAYMREDEKKQGQKILKKFNETVYGQDSFDWDKTYSTLNHLYDNIVSKMRQKYPELDESEFRICCLTYAELNNTEISIIMGFKINTVQAKKYSIRKKLGINGYGNINDFLKEDMGLKA